MRTVRILLALSLFLIVPLAGFAEENEGGEFVWEGVRFDLEDIEGDDLTEEDVFTGADLYLVDFWASWCRPCSQYLPHLEQMMEDYEELGFKVVIFCVDNAATLSTAKSTIAGEDYPFTILFDTANDVKNELGVRNIPTTILFNAEGEELWRHAGYSPGTEVEVREHVEEFLPSAVETDEE